MGLCKFDEASHDDGADYSSHYKSLPANSVVMTTILPPYCYGKCGVHNEVSPFVNKAKILDGHLWHRYQAYHPYHGYDDY